MTKKFKFNTLEDSRIFISNRKLSAISIPCVPEYGQPVRLFIGMVLLYVV